MVRDEDRNANFKAMFSGNRILSAYQVGDSCVTIWIITEADRSVTTFLLPSEY
ncbi:hypothetical protein [Lichenifustis flavocetrariae]|uniref:Uncharacterized protein n=1 Tax=Lichenifustis flavocetrariae TaxID=2949735 RepID=A0AA41Z1I7_9HYPH|nr:hypothetical protein [Lichenifustis flavocetrariae]MCW6512516.1 hypothetical protein [Lichenifustis flavocetrariae]